MRSAAKTGARSAIGRTSRGLSESRRWRDKTFWSRGLVWVCVWSYLSVLIMPSASRFIVLLPVSIQFRGHRKSPNVSPAATPGATHSYYGVDIISMTVAAIFSWLNCLIHSSDVSLSQPLNVFVFVWVSAAYRCLWSRASRHQRLIPSSGIRTSPLAITPLTAGCQNVTSFAT